MARWQAGEPFAASSRTLAAPARTIVWIVDNNSIRSTVEMVRSQFPSVSLVESGENTGSSRTMNSAVAAESAPNVIALNRDAELRDNTLETLHDLLAPWYPWGRRTQWS